METLSPQDAGFLYVENEYNHMAIAALGIFEGPPPGENDIEEMVASKLDLVPRYRQRVRFPPYDLGRPVWCDDPHFHLRYHVRHTALPAPGTEDRLRTLVGRVMSQQLDRTKPLWEMWIVEGLAGRKWAVLLKLHHCMADGVAATDLLNVILDETPDPERRPVRPWQPDPEPSALSLASSAVIARLTSPREALASLREAIDAPKRVLSKMKDFVDGLVTFRHFANLAVESSLNGPIGAHRTWRWAATTLDDVKRIRRVHGGTVNDVVLAAITQGFRDLLISRGEAVEGLVVRSLVPVSVRREDEHDVLNNRVSAMFAELPVGIEDPVERLSSIRAQMNDLKRHHQSAAGEILMSLSGLAPSMMLAAAARTFADIDQFAVQTVTTNVPGPRHALYAAGRAMQTAYLYVPLATSVRIGIAIFSYAGRLTFGVTGDYDHAPDTDVLCRGIESGIEDMLAAGPTEIRGPASGRQAGRVA